MPRRSFRSIEAACLLLMVTLIAPAAVASTTETDALVDELLSDPETANDSRSNRDIYRSAAVGVQAGSGNSFIEGEYRPILPSGNEASGNEGVFENGPNGIPSQVWEVVEEETGLPNLGGVLDGEVTVEDVWDMVDSQYDLPDYGSIFGDNGSLGGSYEDVIINNFGGGGVIPTESYFGEKTPSGSGVGTVFVPPSNGGGTIPNRSGGGTIPLPPSNGDGTTPGNGSGTIPHGNPLPAPGGGTTSSAPQQPRRYNPFSRIIQWSKRVLINPVLKAMGIGPGPRRSFQGNALGSLTRNSVVKSRDQANLLDQELARLLAEPRLGEEGERWIEEESNASQDVLEVGLNESNLAIAAAAGAEKLTSTQDVAKAVARIGGHNAQVGASNLTLQAQNQAALLQLQQLMSANIKLGANVSEGIDEMNRRDRLERSRAFSDSAGETLFLPGVF